MAIIKSNPGRFVSLHVKDEVINSKGSAWESTVLGKGEQAVKELVAEGLKTGGTKHLIIEQEAYQGIAPLECVKQDLAVLKNWGY